jgi:hypothetical protein
MILEIKKSREEDKDLQLRLELAYLRLPQRDIDSLLKKIKKEVESCPLRESLDSINEKIENYLRESGIQNGNYINKIIYKVNQLYTSTQPPLIIDDSGSRVFAHLLTNLRHTLYVILDKYYIFNKWKTK